MSKRRGEEGERRIRAGEVEVKELMMQSIQTSSGWKSLIHSAIISKVETSKTWSLAKELRTQAS
eukprot:749529-Hanusia_phi.AAC.2